MLDNKIIFVAGGAGLLGLALCQEIIKQGGTVIIGEPKKNITPETSDRLLQVLKASDFMLVPLDINNQESLRAAISTSINALKKIDAFINCAYPKNANYGRSFFDVTYSDFSENVSLHLGGYFLAMQQFSDYFSQAGGGVILNFASIYGVIPPKFEIYHGTSMTMPVEYAAIKAGIIQLTQYAAKFLKGRDIRINSISPGGILNGQDEVFIERYNSHCVSKGMLNPGDISQTVTFLLSDGAKYITGQNVIVDDGFSL